MERVTVNIVNRDYPPYRGITGESAAELAGYLLNAGLVVNVIHVDASYFGKNEERPVGNLFKIKPVYNGENRIMRLFSNLLSGYLLIRKSKKIACDVTIVMTDPSLLNMWASLLLKKRKWMLWSMDLYPEAFAAWGLISEKSLLYTLYYKLSVKNAPQAVISLGPLQTGFIRKRYHNRSIKYFQLPCGIFDINAPAADRPSWAGDGSKTCIGYIGNLGAPHSLDFLFAVVDWLDPEKFKMVVSVYGYGSKTLALKEYINGKEGIEIIPPVKREHLKYIDIHLASLLPQCTHISVPSKTVSSVCAGSAFLYYGKAESDNWHLLQEAGWLLPAEEHYKCSGSNLLNSKLSNTDNMELIPAEADVNDGVKDFFQNFNLKKLEDKKAAAHELSGKLKAEKAQTMKEILAFITSQSIRICNPNVLNIRI